MVLGVFGGYLTIGIFQETDLIRGSDNALKHALSMRFLIMAWYDLLKTENQKSTFQSKIF